MEQLTLDEVAVLTGKATKKNPPRKADIILHVSVFIAMVVIGLFFKLNKIDVNVLIMAPLVLWLLYILIPKWLYPFIGRHSRKLQIKFVEEKIAKLEKEEYIIQSEKDVLAGIVWEVFADLVEEDFDFYSHLRHMLETSAIDPQENLLNKELLYKEVKERVESYLEKKKEMEQELNNLKGILSELENEFCF